MSTTAIISADTTGHEMTPYETGFRDGYDKRPKATPADPDLEAYAVGYGDGCQLRDDEFLEQIMNTYPDDTRAIRGLWSA